MKTKLTTLIILASLFLTACKPQNKLEPYIGEYTELLTEWYGDYCCDYPKTLDELLSLYEADTSCIEYSNIDTIKTVLSFLENEKDDIIWEYCHPTILTLTVGAFYKADTLFYNTGGWYSAYLEQKIDYYIRKHMEYPKSLEQLLHFDSIACGKYEDYPTNCWKATRKYLWDIRDKLEWIVKDDSFLIKSVNDTIYYSSDIRCMHQLDVIRNMVMVFTDAQGKYDYKEETKEDFLTGLRILMTDFRNRNQHVNYDFYMVEYHYAKGLNRFCENDEFSLDTEWFKKVEKYVSQFAQEHGFERILFFAPAY